MHPQVDPYATTVRDVAASPATGGLLTDTEVELLGLLATEFNQRISDARGSGKEVERSVRENVRVEIAKRLHAQNHPWADEFAHAVAFDYIGHDAKYRVLLDRFNDWVARIETSKKIADRISDVERIDAGSFGIVFRGKDNARKGEDGTGSPVAIKLPYFGRPVSDHNDARWAARQILSFFLEARRHVGITVGFCVPLLHPEMPDIAVDVGSSNAAIDIDKILEWLRTRPIWFSMQLIEGTNLKSVIESTSYSPSNSKTKETAIGLMTKVAEILRDLHGSKLPGTNDFLIHKDLKPANILLDQQGNPWLTDFGLATPRASQLVFGNPSSGTPTYMAPEQWQSDADCANAADTRTDIWAWGAIFHELLTGQPPFVVDHRKAGEARLHELRDRILHEDPDPLARTVSDIPPHIPPIIRKCLQRDRNDRFQAFKDVVDALSNLRPSKDFSLLDKVKTGPDVFGREEWFDRLGHFLSDSRTRILVLHAFGGFGKTALVKEWKRRLAREGWGEINQAFGYSFYGQGQHGTYVDSQQFLSRALSTFGDPNPTAGEAFEKVDRLITSVCAAKTLLVVDGVEVIQNPLHGDRATELRDEPFHEFLLKLVESNFSGLCLLTTRFPSDSLRQMAPAIEHLELPRLELPPARDLLHRCGVHVDTLDLDGGSAADRLIEEYAGHPLSLMLVGTYIGLKLDGDPRRRTQIPEVPAEEQRSEEYQHNHSHRVIRAYEEALRSQGSIDELHLMDLLAVFDRPVDTGHLRKLACSPSRTSGSQLNVPNPARFESALETLQRYRLLSVDLESDRRDDDRFVDMHPLIRSFFRSRLKTKDLQSWKNWNQSLCRLLLQSAPIRLSALESVNTSSSESPKQHSSEASGSLSHSRIIRERQLEAAGLLTEAIRHGCEAGNYWDAFAVLMARFDQQLQPAPELGLRSLFAIWRALTSSRWLAAGTTFSLRNVLNSVFWLKGVFQRSPQVDAPINLYAAKRLQAWDLRLSCVSHFYPEQNFQCAPYLEEGIASSVFDLITSYTLVHVGRTNEARVIARRVYERFAETGIRVFTYVAASGVALLELYTGHLPSAVSMAEEARRVAQTPQQLADALAMQAFVLDLQGETEEARLSFESAFRLVSRLSTRCTYLHWKRLIRRGKDVQLVSDQLDREFRSGPSPDNAGAHLDWNTMARNVRLHLDYRRTVEALEFTPLELLSRVEHVYDDFSEHFHAGFHHRTMMQFHRARALTLCALHPGCEDGDFRRAEAALNSALRHAKTGGFRMVEVDTLIQRQRLLSGVGRGADAAEVSAVARNLATEIGYAWGLEDLNRCEEG